MHVPPTTSVAGLRPGRAANIMTHHVTRTCRVSSL